MKAIDHIKERQRLWALRHGIGFDQNRRTDTPEQNLFERLSAEARQEFEAADGGELEPRGKMCSLHSSSALCCQVFNYPRQAGILPEVLRAWRLATGSVAGCQFEARLPITAGPEAYRFRRPANLDFVVQFQSGKAIGFESKFTEPYSSHSPKLSPTYLQVEGLWANLQACRSLAETLAAGAGGFEYLDPAQLLKHTLALQTAFGRGCFTLVYLWYDAPGPESCQHRAEIQRFAQVMAEDEVDFRSPTHQELIYLMASRFRDGHEPYVDYLAERYL